MRVKEMECKICDKKLNAERDDYVTISKEIICKECMDEFIATLFAQREFNKFLDSFIQSRIERYIPEYDEYFNQYDLDKCDDCNGSGYTYGMMCRKCNGIGATKRIDINTLLNNDDSATPSPAVNGSEGDQVTSDSNNTTSD